MEPAEILEKAADLLESGEAVWTQEDGYFDRLDDGRLACCMMGAVYWVEGTLANGESFIHFTVEEIPPVAVKAESALKRHLGLLELDQNVETWNDAPGRTLPEVIDALKLAAKDARNIEGES